MSKRTFDEMSGGGQHNGLPTASLLNSGLYSDLVIKCQGREWKAHRLVIGLQSKPFAAAISGGFEETKTGIIKLDDHKPEIVGHMLDFLYSGDYTVPTPQADLKSEETPATKAASGSTVQSETASFSPTNVFTGMLAPSRKDTSKELLIHAEVYLIAEEKDIPALKSLAKKRYDEALPNGWNSPEFCTSLGLIYDGTPENDRLLWDAAVKFAGKKAKELLDRGEFVELCKDNGEIGLEIFKEFVANLPIAPVVSKRAPGTCPIGLAAHSSYIGTGRRKKYWCPLCTISWND